MGNMHTCYMKYGSIYSSYSGCIIERPAILVSGSYDILHAWGNFENVEDVFNEYVDKYTKAGFTDEVKDLTLIELSNYEISREMACYVLRRATEFTASNFIRNLCDKLTDGSDVVAWLKTEMERVPIDINKKEW